jgi:hypothetical protein
MKINRHTRRRIKRFLRSQNGTTQQPTPVIPKFVYENGVEVLRLWGPRDYLARPVGAKRLQCDLSAASVFAAWGDNAENLLKLVRAALVLSKD